MDGGRTQGGQPVHGVCSVPCVKARLRLLWLTWRWALAVTLGFGTRRSLRLWRCQPRGAQRSFWRTGRCPVADLQVKNLLSGCLSDGS